MSPRISVDLVMRYASHNFKFIYSIQPKEPQRVPHVSTRESRQERVPTPMLRSQSHGTRKLSTITHIKCSQIIKDSIRQQNLKGKTQFIKKIERGKTPYDSSISTKPALHQDLSISRTRERERERDTTHSYWYIPSAPMENYSLLIMETSGKMMAFGDDSPSGRLPKKVPIGFSWIQRLVAAELLI